MMRRSRQRLAFLAVAASVSLAACGGGGEEATPPPEVETAVTEAATTETAPAETAPVETAPTETEAEEPPPATTAPSEEHATDDREVYLNAGCAGCHGENGEGTEIAPSLPGHSEEQVIRQVRAPLGQMPAYSESQLSDIELEAIVAFVVSLEVPAEGMHVEPIGPGVVASHHWMAISALRADNVADAIHHVEHILERVKGEHREVMQQARRLLEEGELHEAEHLIEDMLAGQAEPGLELAELHLQTALNALATDDREGVAHHLGHFIEEARGEKRREGQRLLDALHEGELHEVEDGIRALLGLGHA